MSLLQKNTLKETLDLMKYQCGNIEGAIEDLGMVINCSVLSAAHKLSLNSMLVNLEKELTAISADISNSLKTLEP